MLSFGCKRNRKNQRVLESELESESDNFVLESESGILGIDRLESESEPESRFWGWNWNRNGISGLLAGIGIRTGIRLLNFPGIGTVIGIKIYPESCITDIGQIRAYCGSGLYQKFYCILLLPTSGGILQLVYSTGAPPMGPEQENKK